MDNVFDELTGALVAARALQRACEAQADKMAELLDGHLRGVGAYRLQRLKKQLARFNAHTGRWKE